MGERALTDNDRAVVGGTWGRPRGWLPQPGDARASPGEKRQRFKWRDVPQVEGKAWAKTQGPPQRSGESIRRTGHLLGAAGGYLRVGTGH